MVPVLGYPETLLAAAASLLVFLALNRLRLVPIDWPVLGMLPGLLSNVHRIHEFATDVLAFSGCTFFLKGPWGASMDILVTADPANVNHVFSTNFANYPKGPEFSEIFDVLGGGIFTADDDEWKLQRRITHTLMAEKSFRRYVVDSSRAKLEKGLIPVLERASDAGAVVDFQDLFLRFTFDVTCLLVMGTDPLCLTPDLPDVPFATAMDDVEEIAVYRHVLPAPVWKLLRCLDLLQERRYARAHRTIDRYVAAHVARRRDDPRRSPDILSSLLAGGDPRFTSDAFLRDAMVNLMLAGRDTTAAGLSWFFWLVSRDPRVRGRILEELGEREQPAPGGLPETEELGKMTYLHAALLEALRLYPPVPFEHKRAAREETLPSGQRVTPEMRLIVSLYAMARMEGVWGKGCREFLPERWINERGRLRHEPSYKFMSFNSGPRTCLGKDIALAQMKAAAAAVLGAFEFDLVEGHKVEPKPSILLHMKEGLKVRVRRRLQLL